MARQDSYFDATTVARFLVTFVGAGDVGLIVAMPTTAARLAGCSVVVTEFLKGMENSFTIQPKQVIHLVHLSYLLFCLLAFPLFHFLYFLCFLIVFSLFYFLVMPKNLILFL